MNMNVTTSSGNISTSGGNFSGVRTSTKNLVLTGLFVAIIFLMAFVPNLGYINLIVIKATLIHIPVILGAIFLGPKTGAFLGGVFGLTSFINNTLSPSLLSFAFSPVISFQMFGAAGILKTLYICFVPRILIGVGAYFIYSFVRSLGSGKLNRTAALAAAGAGGAIINTIFVMGGIFVLYSTAFAEARQIAASAVFDAIMAIVMGNGVPEALVSGIIVSAVGSAIMAATRNG